MTFANGLCDSGRHVASDALQRTDTATTVRVRNGKVSITDGPFAETKEQLAGFYVIEAQTLDEALAEFYEWMVEHGYDKPVYKFLLT